jgi:hypothetical protein
MKNRRFIFAIMAFVLLFSLACGAFGGTSQPQEPQSNPGGVNEPPTQKPLDQSGSSGSSGNSGNSGNSGSSEYSLFTDGNDLAQFEIPSDWKYEHNSSDNVYVDTFTAPDGNALIENLVYDDGSSFTGGVNGKFALYLLHTYYSATGKEGDIKVLDDAVQSDGSERLVWTSRSGGFSGVSFFEVRNKTTFLMLTGKWADEFEDTYLPVMNNAIATYKIP